MSQIFTCLRRQSQCGFLVLTLVLAGCATTSPTLTRPESDSPAVMSLLSQARSNAASGYYANAEASLERALRMEQGNAYLWYELASVALQQGQLRQAENLGLRADSFAGQNRSLKGKIWQLIGESRAGLGNKRGAREAFLKAHAIDESLLR